MHSYCISATYDIDFESLCILGTEIWFEPNWPLLHHPTCLPVHYDHDNTPCNQKLRGKKIPILCNWSMCTKFNLKIAAYHVFCVRNRKKQTVLHFILWLQLWYIIYEQFTNYCTVLYVHVCMQPTLAIHKQ